MLFVPTDQRSELLTNKEKVRREIQKNSLSKNDYDNETDKHTIRQKNRKNLCKKNTIMIYQNTAYNLQRCTNNAQHRKKLSYIVEF